MQVSRSPLLEVGVLQHLGKHTRRVVPHLLQELAQLLGYLGRGHHGSVSVAVGWVDVNARVADAHLPDHIPGIATDIFKVNVRTVPLRE